MPSLSQGSRPCTVRCNFHQCQPTRTNDILARFNWSNQRKVRSARDLSLCKSFDRALDGFQGLLPGPRVSHATQRRGSTKWPFRSHTDPSRPSFPPLLGRTPICSLLGQPGGLFCEKRRDPAGSKMGPKLTGSGLILRCATGQGQLNQRDLAIELKIQIPSPTLLIYCPARCCAALNSAQGRGDGFQFLWLAPGTR